MNRRDFLKGVGGVIGLGEMSARANPMLAVAQAVGGSGSSRNRSPIAEPDYAALLAQHDIVYLTPTHYGPEGLPIGNGDLMGHVWIPPEGLELGLNKSNLWDDRLTPPPLAENWAWDVGEEEQWTAPVTGARLKIHSRLPLIDPLYLDAFQARLNLHEARVSMQSSSPLGKVSANAWISNDPAVTVVNYDEAAREPVSREIELSRWGSRRFFHWYSQYRPDATQVGLDGTQAGAGRDHIWVEQKLRKISFAVVARLVGVPYRTEVRSRHGVAFITDPSDRLQAQVYLAIVTSEEDPAPLQAARRRVDEAATQGHEVLLNRHRQHWAAFWAKSYIQIPNGYLENLYYFTLYQLAASSQGDYPPTDCGGFWTWNHDVRRWGHYYQWNVQQQYWPVHASNHAELARPYLDFRFRTLPEAKKYAREVHNREGAFYSDVTDRWGRGAIHDTVSYIFTAGPEVAMDFWRHYLYDPNLEFLRERAYPIMKACAQFYLETARKEADGKYHIPKATAYENHLFQKDPITDLATIRQFFPACIQASEILSVDAALRERWREVVENLVEMAVLDNVIDEDGRKWPKVFSSGLPLVDSTVGPDLNFFMKSKRKIKKGERQFNISFFCEVAPIFPTGIIGLKQKGTELFEVARTTVRALGDGPSWGSTPTIAAARLGMKEEANALLTNLVQALQLAPQGFFAQGSHQRTTLGENETWGYSPYRMEMNTARKIIDGNRTNEQGMLPSCWFDNPELEVGGVLMTTLNEMLLQSHDGLIRIFPTAPDGWQDAAFKLRAVGAFLVTAERQAGELKPVAIESLRGRPCQVENPWTGSEVRVRDLSSRRLISVQQNEGILAFDTQEGSSYLIFRKGDPETLPGALRLRSGANQNPKEWQGRRLGIPRYF